MHAHRSAAARRGALLFAILIGTTLLAGCLNEFDTEPDNRAWIQGIDVAAPRVGSGSLTLLVNVTLDNREAASGDLTLQVKAYNTATGLLTDTIDADVGRLPKDHTTAIPLLLTLPKEHGYRLNAFLFQDDLRIHTAVVRINQVSHLAPNLAETDLVVRTLDFLVDNVTDDRVRIQAKVYLTNEGGDPSTPIRMQVKVREASTGLLTAEDWADVASIIPEATTPISTTFDVPDSFNYIIEAILWDDDFIVADGQGTVQLLPSTTVAADQTLVTTDPAVTELIFDSGHSGDAAGDSASESREEATPGPALVLVLALIATILIWTRRHHA